VAEEKYSRQAHGWLNYKKQKQRTCIMCCFVKECNSAYRYLCYDFKQRK